MKTKTLAPLLALLLVGTTTVALAAGPNRGPWGPSWPSARNSASQMPLSPEEADLLLWIREEEKLARDVYLGLFEQWQAQEFSNIARSEQRHFDAIGANITMSGLADPALPYVGRFTNPELEELYYSLLTTGNTSYADALRVGATIEDLDIRDLMVAIEVSENTAVKRTYDSLLEGSKNHMRAFVSRLAAQGVEYEPQYIDPVLFDAIVGR